MTSKAIPVKQHKQTKPTKGLIIVLLLKNVKDPKACAWITKARASRRFGSLYNRSYYKNNKHHSQPGGIGVWELKIAHYILKQG